MINHKIINVLEQFKFTGLLIQDSLLDEGEASYSRDVRRLLRQGEKLSTSMQVNRLHCFGSGTDTIEKYRYLDPASSFPKNSYPDPIFETIADLDPT